MLDSTDTANATLDDPGLHFASPFGITVLRCQYERDPQTGVSFWATKPWTPKGDGTYKVGGYNAGTWFYVREVPAWSLAEQYNILKLYSQFPTVFVVRGALTAEIRARLKTEPKQVIRCLVDEKKHRSVAFSRDIMRSYFWDDIDKFRLRPIDDLIRDPDSAVRYAIQETLPACFHNVPCWYQLSAGCGAVPGRMSVHIGYDTGNPMRDTELKARINALKRPTLGSPDTSVCAPAQKFWIANPVMLGADGLPSGAPDPLPRRWGWLGGSRATVTVPPVPPRPPRPVKSRDDPAGESPQTWQRDSGGRGIDGALALMGDDTERGQKGFHGPGWKACWCYASACRRAAIVRDDAAFAARLQDAVAAAPKSPGKDRARYLSAAYWQTEIDSAVAKLDRRAAEQPLLMAHPVPVRISTPNRLDAPRRTTTGCIARFWADAAKRFGEYDG